MLLSKLPAALVSSKQGYDVYFTALSRVLSDPKSMTPSILEFLFTSIEKSLEELLCLESVSQKKGITRVDISRGHGLVCLLHIIWSVSSEEWGTTQLRSSKSLINSVITSFLRIRKIELIKNKVLLESKDYLEKLLDSLHLDCSLAQKATFLEQCIESFLSLQDSKEQLVLLEQMLKIIDPPRAEPVYHITLERLHTQEDYIRRNISKNNYTSKDIGPLMQHVRQKIAKEIDIAEPDVLELLVNEQIIAPQLKVTEVYEHIAWPYFQAENAAFLEKTPSDFPSAELPPMVVIFRLAGIDGEATEDIVDTIPTMDLDEASAEEKFAVTSVISESGMLKHSLSLLAAQSPLSPELLSVLTFACQIHSNREELCVTGGVQVIFGILDVSQKAKFKKVVALIELLVSDELTQPYVAGYPAAVSAILNLLHNETDHEFTSEIIRIIPYVSNGNAPACQQIVAFFDNEIDLAALKRLVTNKIEEEIMNILSDALVAGQQIDPRFKFMLEGLVVMLDSLLVHHQTLKESFYHAGFTLKFIEIFCEVQLESANPWYVVALINSLKGLLTGFQPAQALFPLGALEKMFHMQKSSHDIGTAAECFIETILLSPALAHAPCIEKLTSLIVQERTHKRLKAEHKREELLKQFTLPELDIPEEESGLACVICQEGYTFKPNDILGFYIYSSPYTVDNSVESPEETSTGTTTIMSTVTHFNCIHYSCHQQATKAGRTLRRPKSEWEGATIRNQHTKCNNWFPIKGPAITKDDYDNSVDRMFSIYNLYENRIRNCLHDLGLLLYRFCEEESFSKESKGGGPEHNLHAIPYLLQLLGFLAEVTPNEATACVAALERFQGSLKTLSPNGLLFFLCLCVNYMNREQWETVKPELIVIAKLVARKAPKKRDRITGISSPADAGEELLTVANGVRSVFIGIKLCDMVFNVLFAHCGESWKESTVAYLDSADPSIHERTLQMHISYKRYLSCSTLEQLAVEMEFRKYIAEESLLDWISN